MVLLMFCMAAGPLAEADAMERKSVVAGAWYPGDPNELRAVLNSFLQQADVSIAGQGREGLRALVVPHAGYVYSGPVAAYAYKLLERQKYDTVVIIGPSHRAAFDKVSVYDQGGYRTPLGLVSLDTEFINALKRNDSGVRYVPKAHKEEHSIEIQLPFLQVVQPGCRIVPLIMGSQDRATCESLAKALAKTIEEFAGKKRVLLVASSDLSHYYDSETATEKDRRIISALNTLNPDNLQACLANRSCEACGGGPVLAVMKASMLLGADKGLVLKYGDSGDITGDKQRVVGYLAAAVFGTKSRNHAVAPEPRRVSPAERTLLHTIARKSIEARMDGKPYVLPEKLSPLLLAHGAAFVTLKKDGRLRGCIGHIIAREPLARTVSEMAKAAAFEDPRFPPLKKEELAGLSYEISVLTPLKKIQNPEDVHVGVHGVLMRRGGHSGLLLPQVPVEYGWDRETFLQNTCRKAGMPADCWQDKSTEIYIFSAEVF